MLGAFSRVYASLVSPALRLGALPAAAVGVRLQSGFSRPPAPMGAGQMKCFNCNEECVCANALLFFGVCRPGAAARAASLGTCFFCADPRPFNASCALFCAPPVRWPLTPPPPSSLRPLPGATCPGTAPSPAAPACCPCAT